MCFLAKRLGRAWRDFTSTIMMRVCVAYSFLRCSLGKKQNKKTYLQIGLEKGERHVSRTPLLQIPLERLSSRAAQRKPANHCCGNSGGGAVILSLPKKLLYTYYTNSKQMYPKNVVVVVAVGCTNVMGSLFRHFVDTYLRRM